jgi:hypothetical protein
MGNTVHKITTQLKIAMMFFILPEQQVPVTGLKVFFHKNSMWFDLHSRFIGWF